MEEILNNYSLSDIFMIGILFGFIFSSLDNLLQSIADYTRKKAWLVNDYERILYKTYNDEQYNEKDIECMGQAVLNYKKRLDKRKKIENFFNKFKWNFKREQT